MKTYNQTKKSFFKVKPSVPKFDILSSFAPEELKKRDEEIRAQEAKEIKNMRNKAFLGCGINEDTKNCTFQNYTTKLDAQKEALSLVWDFCKQVTSGEFGTLVLYGCPGSGKTHLVTALLNVVIHSVKKNWNKDFDEYYSGRYVLSRNISSALMETYSYSSKTTYDGVINNFCIDDLLVIDEIGRDPLATSGESSGLFAIIDKRKSKGKPIAMCTNCNWEEFSKLLGSAAMSRIMQKPTIVDMTAIPDYRMNR